MFKITMSINGKKSVKYKKDYSSYVCDAIMVEKISIGLFGIKKSLVFKDTPKLPLLPDTGCIFDDGAEFK